MASYEPPEQRNLFRKAQGAGNRMASSLYYPQMKNAFTVTTPAAELLRDPAFLGLCDGMPSEPATPPTEPSRTVGEQLRLHDVPLRHRQKISRRRYVDVQGVENAVDRIGALPKNGEAVHFICDGSFQGVQIIPAIIQKAGRPADVALIATLSFNTDNIDLLCGMLDARHVKQMALLCSTYFRAGNVGAFDYAIKELGRRGVSVTAARSHCKITLLHIGQSFYIVEGSANLRSCHACEQMTLHHDAGLFRFYRRILNHIMQEVS